jgi:hypothetical protein
MIRIILLQSRWGYEGLDSHHSRFGIDQRRHGLEPAGKYLRQRLSRTDELLRTAPVPTAAPRLRAKTPGPIRADGQRSPLSGNTRCATTGRLLVGLHACSPQGRKISASHLPVSRRVRTLQLRPGVRLVLGLWSDDSSLFSAASETLFCRGAGRRVHVASTISSPRAIPEPGCAWVCAPVSRVLRTY